MNPKIIDETFINITLKGGNLHSELIHVEATFIKGQFKGQSVPLKCQWYNITKDNDFVEVEDISGQFYQPCILDIDTKIMVQAVPILDYEYNGMPLMAETNYLQADHKIFDLVNQAFNEGVLSLSCKLENCQGTIPQIIGELSLPAVCQLSANEKGLHLDQIISLEKYEMRIIKKNNNQIEVCSDNIKLLISLSNHIVRDALYQFSKTLKAKKTNLNDAAQLYAKIADQEQKLQKQQKEISQLEDQKLKQKTVMNELQTQNLQLTKKVESLEKASQSSTQQIEKKEKEIQNLKSQVDKLDGKIQFYVQEIKILKSQAITLENSNKKQLQEIEELKKNHHESQDDYREIFYREKLDNLKQQHDLEKCLKENQQWQLINDQLMKEIKNLEHSNSYFQEEKEILQNELNNLKRKYESLLKESEINQMKEKSESQISDSNSNKQSEILSNQILNNNVASQDEVKRLKTTISNLEATIRSLKNEYEQDMLKFTNKSFLKSNTSQEIQILQKLANSLAESLSDKEQALQTQRNINRELMNKIQEISK